MRTVIEKEKVSDVLLQIDQHTSIILKEKGYGSFSSIHEISGVLAEEYHEAIEAVHRNDTLSLKQELLDIAAVCQFAIACIDKKTLDW
jgi:uncharacterized protein YciW